MNGWISVKDRLPAEGELVWAAVRSLSESREAWTVEVVYCTLLDRIGGAWDITMVEWNLAEVYAWMPAEYPKPPRLEEYV